MSGIRVDGHVHLHRGVDLPRAVRAVSARAAAGPGELVLLLAEGPRERVLPRLRGAPGVVVEDTAEAGSVRVRGGPDGNGGTSVTIVHGRQLVSADGLEVLALGLPPAHPIGDEPDRSRPTTELLARVLDTSAVGVLPWGVGKWLGGRGRIVDAIASGPLARHPRFALGDIFHRTWPWPEPAAFRAGPPILRGTDPLRIPGLEDRPGAYGSIVEGRLDPERPWASIRDAIEAGGIGGTFGRPASPFLALREQIRVRRAPLPGSAPIDPGPDPAAGARTPDPGGPR